MILGILGTGILSLQVVVFQGYRCRVRGLGYSIYRAVPYRAQEGSDVMTGVQDLGFRVWSSRV